MTLPAGVVDLLGTYLARQRWYAGTGVPEAGSLKVIDSACLASLDGGAHRLHWAIVEVAGERYQLLIGEAPSAGTGGATGSSAGSPAAEGDPTFLGEVGSSRFSDATNDPELMLALFEQVTGLSARSVRPVGAEQSNTSLVFDDRTIVKIYRRLIAGANPDIEVTSALASVGFEHIAEPVGTWRADGVDLAFAQRFLSGGSEGWALALASVGEVCDRAADGGGTTADGPGAPGGDFEAEATRLGRMTAELHVALARAFPVDADAVAAVWPAFVDDLHRRIQEELAEGSSPALDRLIERLRQVRHPGPAVRVHGDFHLGQVMRSGGEWYVLDFEGEPARSMEERLRPTSVAKDVAGMLRSFDYAGRFVLRQRQPVTAASDATCVMAWEQANRAAFLDGYFTTPGIEPLLAGADDRDWVLAAFELDKALYELRYEHAYRPDWVDIPQAAIGRIVGRFA